MANEAKREALKERIEAGRQRIAERDYAQSAKDAAEAATTFVKKHPLATLGGAIAVGLAIGAMTKRGRKLGQRGGVIAGLLADAAIAYGVQMIDQMGDIARDGQDRLEDLGDTISDKTRSAKRDASHLAGTASDKTLSAARRTRRKAGRAIRDLRSRATH